MPSFVIEPYTKEVFDQTFKWIAEHDIFVDGGMGSCQYEQAIATLTPTTRTSSRSASIP